MYHRSAEEIAYIAVSAPGPGSGQVRSSPAGERRSKDGASLDFTTADAEIFVEEIRHGLSKQSANGDVDPRRAIFLVNPSMDDFREAVKEAQSHIDQWIGTPSWGGGGLSLFFSGHGREPDGALCLSEYDLVGEELAEILAAGVNPRNGALGVELHLDACFAGAFLGHFLSALDERLVPRDMLLAALHDELAWEVPNLGHGILTYSAFARKYDPVDRSRLAGAVETGDEEYLRMALHREVPNPVTYLSYGDQHAIEVISGHQVEVQGCGYFECLDSSFRPEHFFEALHRARSAANRIEVPF